jgi:hypothetical protein
MVAKIKDFNLPVSSTYTARQQPVAAMTAFVVGTSVALRSSTFARNVVSVRPVAAAPVFTMMAKSKSVPFLECPPKLENADIPGNRNFDPLGFSSYYDLYVGASAVWLLL